MEPGGGIPGGLPIGGACCPDPGGGPERTILAIGSLWRERIHFLVSTVSLSLEVEEQRQEDSTVALAFTQQSRWPKEAQFVNARPAVPQKLCGAAVLLQQLQLRAMVLAAATAS